MEMIRRICFVIVALGLGGLCLAANKCSHCSADVLATDTFCLKCGHRILAPAPEPATEPEPPPPTSPSTYSPPPQYRQPLKRPAEPSPRQDDPPSPSYRQAESFVTPIKLSIIGPISLPTDQQCSVYGLHLGVIGGYCPTMTGISISGAGSNCKTMKGICIGGIGTGCDEAYGASIVGIFNILHKTAYGLQVGIVNGIENDGGMYGCQIGVVNFAGRKSRCLQIGAINTIGTRPDSRILPLMNMNF